MRHNESNPLCDKNVYGPDASDVRCTCDVDDPADAPAPSVVMPAGPPAPHTARGNVVLAGSQADAYMEWCAATRELDAARKLLAPAEQRWKAAVDRLAAEALR